MSSIHRDSHTFRKHQAHFSTEARRLLSAGKPDQAVELCKKGLASHPAQVAGYIVLAAAYEALGDQVRADRVREDGFRRTGFRKLAPSQVRVAEQTEEHAPREFFVRAEQSAVEAVDSESIQEADDDEIQGTIPNPPNNPILDRSEPQENLSTRREYFSRIEDEISSEGSAPLSSEILLEAPAPTFGLAASQADLGEKVPLAAPSVPGDQDEETVAFPSKAFAASEEAAITNALDLEELLVVGTLAEEPEAFPAVADHALSSIIEESDEHTLDKAEHIEDGSFNATVEEFLEPPFTEKESGDDIPALAANQEDITEELAPFVEEQREITLNDELQQAPELLPVAPIPPPSSLLNRELGGEIARAREERPRLALHTGKNIARLRSANLRLIPGLEFAPLRHEDQRPHPTIAPILEDQMPGWNIAERSFGVLEDVPPLPDFEISTEKISEGIRPLENERIGSVYAGSELLPPSLEQIRPIVTGNMYEPAELEVPLATFPPIITNVPTDEAFIEEIPSELDELAKRLAGAKIQPTPEQHSRVSPAFEPSIVSDTIANILVSQGAWSEALKAFQTLARMKPEKVEYYQTRIAEMKVKIQNEAE